MSSSVSLLPTADFLQAIAQSQWATESDYIVGFSTIPAQFFSTTNSEWLCLNSESELLASRFGTALIEPDFGYTRPETSPTLIASNELKIPDKRLGTARSVFIYRSDGETEEIILNANFSRRGTNQTSAPLLNCFSRECMSWFSSDVEWLTGFGSLSGSLTELIIDSDGIITNKSEDILSGLIEASTQAIAYTSISFNSPSTASPFVSIQFSTGVEYIKTESTLDFNVLFLFNSDSLVAFAANIESNKSAYYNSLKTEISFSQDIIII